MSQKRLEWKVGLFVFLCLALLGLLVVLIGEGLTLRLVREAWPKLSLNHLHFGKENKR